MPRLTLSTIGSHGVTIEIDPSPLPEAAGGVQLRVHFTPDPDREPMTYTGDRSIAMSASASGPWRGSPQVLPSV